MENSDSKNEWWHPVKNEDGAKCGKSDKSALLAKLPLFDTMDKAIDAAAQHLPEGYVLAIRIEKNGYGVVLEDSEGNDIDLDGGDGMLSDVWAGIMQANNLPC